MTNQLQLSQISLRCTKKRGAERGLVAGGVGSGKSVLSEILGRDFLQRYPNSRRLILDSKPRFRGERGPHGAKTRMRYRRWDHGASVPNSMLVESPDDLDLCWGAGCRTAIVQDDGPMPWMLAVVETFYRQARASRPQLLQVDETMDWFTTTGSPKAGSDIVVRTARAGRERGLGGLYATQRTKQIPATLLEEMNRLYLFRLDYVSDVKRLPEMGAPVEAEDVPREDYEFRYWWKGDYRHLWGPYQLDLD